MLDWDDLRFFLAIVRHRSLAASSKLLHVTQSTVGRRLASLEAKMGARLVHRVFRTATPPLWPDRQSWKTLSVWNARRFMWSGRWLATTLGSHGVVRVTGSQLMTSHLARTGVLPQLHTRDRSVLIELVPLLPGESVAQHETDVSGYNCGHSSTRIWWFESWGRLLLGSTGHPAYLARCGLPAHRRRMCRSSAHHVVG